jgi:hypothetical protein
MTESTLDIGDVHVLRLCLDLQLDALMLTLGAASSDACPADPPWRRWVDEDVELACSLAADTRAGGAALPQAMGSDLDRSVPTATVDSLRASYASIVTLLSGLISRSGESQRLGDPWQQRVERALEHCRRRQGELEACRTTRPALRVIDHTETTQSPAPGELLG